MQRGFITIYREKLSPYLTKVHCLLSTAESLRVQLPSTVRAQHETELQASGSKSEAKHTKLQQSKVRNFNYSKTGNSLLGHSYCMKWWNWFFEQINLHVPISKWWFLAFYLFINVLQNIAIWSLVINGYWKLLIKHSTHSTISKNKNFLN